MLSSIPATMCLWVAVSSSSYSIYDWFLGSIKNLARSSDFLSERPLNSNISLSFFKDTGLSEEYGLKK